MVNFSKYSSALHISGYIIQDLTNVTHEVRSVCAFPSGKHCLWSTTEIGLGGARRVWITQGDIIEQYYGALTARQKDDPRANAYIRSVCIP